MTTDLKEAVAALEGLPLNALQDANDDVLRKFQQLAFSMEPARCAEANAVGAS